MDIELWYGIFGPAELPAEVVTKWSTELAAVPSSHSARS